MEAGESRQCPVSNKPVSMSWDGAIDCDDCPVRADCEIAAEIDECEDNFCYAEDGLDEPEIPQTCWGPCRFCGQTDEDVIVIDTPAGNILFAHPACWRNVLEEEQ